MENALRAALDDARRDSLVVTDLAVTLTETVAVSAELSPPVCYTPPRLVNISGTSTALVGVRQG